MNVHVITHSRKDVFEKQVESKIEQLVNMRYEYKIQFSASVHLEGLKRITTYSAMFVY